MSMEQKVYFKVASIGGYNKADVMKYLEESQAKFENLKMEKDGQILKIQKEYEQLEEEYKTLAEERDFLKRECDAFVASKEALVKLELDAHLRTKELLDAAKKEAEQLVEKAHQEVNALQEAYVIKAQEELKEIQKIQEEVDGLTTMIAQKNKEVQQYMERFEDVISKS